ncbi:uncharacterized protein BXZ73DRAFT_102792 [Epithele typhae]|uniref:uncharacterized protein n=1 Tax=Epithele typhae TaxID=378194 RepID=UPI0020077385|nr:uncharacterized protein BXZ73DRAFT_102792 [Epithele typhae]KAH9927206.1 hypothetical protein BXZ73DRAFT_102792 [Epithele typhae]
MARPPPAIHGPGRCNPPGPETLTARTTSHVPRRGLYRARPPECAVDWSAVDIVTDTGCLRMIMNWIRRASWRTNWEEVQPEVGFDVQPTGGRALVLHRAPAHGASIEQWEHTALGPGYNVTYGRQFEATATAPAPGCERGLEHYRVMQYDFGGLRLVVRGEVDAYFPLEADRPSVLPPVPHEPAPAPPHPPTPSRSADIAVVPAGTVVPQSSLVELKTEAMRFSGSERRRIWFRTYPRMLLSQTSTLLTTARAQDTFMFARRERVDTDEFLANVAGWLRMQRGFHQLVAVLRRVREVAPVFGAGRPFTAWARKYRLELEELDPARSAERRLLGREDLARFAPRQDAGTKRTRI